MTKSRQWTVMTAVAVLVVLAAGWLLLVKPVRSHAADLRSQASGQQQSNQLLQTQIASLLSEQRSLPQQEKKLQSFTTKVPSEVSEPVLIRQLATAASGSGVDLSGITPGAATAVTSAASTTTTLTAPASSGQLMSLPLTMAVSGTYPNMESFFQLLEKLPRALLVSGWTLAPTDAAGGSTSGPSTAATGAATTTTGELTGTLTASVFYSSDAATGSVTAPTGVVAPPSSTAPAPATTAPASTPAATPAATS